MEDGGRAVTEAREHVELVRVELIREEGSLANTDAKARRSAARRGWRLFLRRVLRAKLSDHRLELRTVVDGRTGTRDCLLLTAKLVRMATVR